MSYYTSDDETFYYSCENVTSQYIACCCCFKIICSNCSIFHKHPDCIHEIYDVNELIDKIIKLLETKRSKNTSLQYLKTAFDIIKDL